MSNLVRAVVEIPRVSAIPEDTVVNVFHFVQDPATAVSQTDLDNIRTALTTFYNTVNGSATKTIAQFFPQAISRVTNAAKIKMYLKTINPSVGDFGSPVATYSWTVGAIDAGPPTGLPGEAAIALSFHGDLTDIPETESNPSPPPAFFRPAARHRGRAYIGPMNESAIQENSGTDFEVKPSSAVLSTLRFSGEMLRDFAYTGGLVWAVYSPTDDDAYEVVDGFVDNAFDTQRRRGNDATSRTLWT